jgi:hypothetical protein
VAATYTDWPDGKKHSIPYAKHLENLRAAAGNPLTLPDPPVGTYDPAIDYNASAANRGYAQTQNDAQTAFEQGQQDYGLGLGDLGTGRDRSLADLLTGKTRSLADLGTNETRLNQDYGFQTSELGRNYGILGRQQGEHAAQQGVTSEGLLGKSQAVRAANQGREQGQLDLSHNRGLEDINTSRTRVGEDYTSGTTRVGEDYNRGKLGLDLGNARTFGGFNGQTVLNPLTGKPEFGSLITGVTRAGAENTAFQTASSQQRAAGAQSMGYVSPLTQPGANSAFIGGQRVTPQQYQSGMFLDALLGSAKIQAQKKTKTGGRTINGVWTPGGIGG